VYLRAVLKQRLTLRQITIDEFIDVLIGTRKYIPCLCPSVYHELLSSRSPHLQTFTTRPTQSPSSRSTSSHARQTPSSFLASSSSISRISSTGSGKRSGSCAYTRRSGVHTQTFRTLYACAREPQSKTCVTASTAASQRTSGMRSCGAAPASSRRMRRRYPWPTAFRTRMSCRVSLLLRVGVLGVKLTHRAVFTK
jgi:hypothetical protein